MRPCLRIEEPLVERQASSAQRTAITDAHGGGTYEGWEFMRAFYENATAVDDANARTQVLTSGEVAIDLNWCGSAFNLARNIG
ncbi:hypothetical protein [Roseicitreum antarcticum]|uniref:Uncharacterized protein n=1 Tax=Roseicitreum antarcticum TaxID=564137 RepID=A0A1H3CYN6_9RHOB|nr:hypothetical protein [Roseicitreum antarcticum]SDX59245.1 hypothetical protein SAMN04488238_11124 [Roseicitreum antarcticum]